MDYESAHRLGMQGEAAVSAELRRLALEQGFVHLDNIMLFVKRMTTQIDHIVVDKHGILILESKVRNGAVIRGRDVDKTWTAVYSARTKPTFPNPLDQTRRQEGVLRQALQSAGHPVEPAYIKRAVVFVGADITKLEMDPIELERVLLVGDLEAYIAARRDFAVNAGDWTGKQIAATAGVLRGLNRSQDPDVARRHSDYRGRGAFESAPSHPERTGAEGTARSTSVPAANRGQAAPAYGTSASSAQGRRTAAAWGRTSNFRRTGSADSLGAEILGLVKRVAVAGAMLMLLWICGVSGMADAILRSFSAGLTHSLTSTAQTSVGAVAAPAGSVSVAVAKQRFREISPDLYARAADLNSPKVQADGDLTTFTWHYIQRQSSNAVKEVPFVLGIAADGTVRSVSTGQ